MDKTLLFDKARMNAFLSLQAPCYFKLAKLPSPDPSSAVQAWNEKLQGVGRGEAAALWCWTGLFENTFLTIV
jgi:hypothetical protein